MKRAILALAIACALPGCGSGPSSPSGPSGPVRTVATSTFMGLEAGGLVFFDLNLPQAGALDITVDWTSATNDIDAALTDGACPDEIALGTGACQLLAVAVTLNKPERIDYNATAGTYKIWVENTGPGRESGTVAVGVTR